MTELAVRTKVLFGLGGVALAVLAWWLFGIVRKPASPEDVSRAAIAAFVEGDADKLYSLMSDDEKKAMKIEPADFAAFFTTIVRPRTASFTPVGEPAIKAQGFRYNQVFTVQEMRADDGRKFKLSFAAAPAGREDSLATHMIVTLFMAAHDASLPPGVLPGGVGRMRSLAKFIDENLEELKRTGINGFVTMADESGLGIRYTWETYADRQRDLAAGRNIEKWRNYGRQ